MNKLFLAIILVACMGCNQRSVIVDNKDGFGVIKSEEYGDNFRYEILEGDYDKSDFDSHYNIGFVFYSSKVFNVGDKVELVKVEEVE